MNNDEKLQLIERALGVKRGKLTAGTKLDSLPQWDSLNILNLQIELTAIRPDLSFDALRECRSVDDICEMI